MQLAFSATAGAYRYFKTGKMGDEFDAVCSVAFCGKTAHLSGAHGEIDGPVLLAVYRHLDGMGFTKVTALRADQHRLPLGRLIEGEWVVYLKSARLQKRLARIGINVEEVAFA
jgi:hypothetical protein